MAQRLKISVPGIAGDRPKATGVLSKNLFLFFTVSSLLNHRENQPKAEILRCQSQREGDSPTRRGTDKEYMSTNPPEIEDEILNTFRRKLFPFIEIARKPRVGSQNCYFCEKQIMKGEWRIKAACSCFVCEAGRGCYPAYCYGHLSCFLKALKAKLKKEGLSIGIHKRTLARLKRERVLAALMQ